MSNDFRLIVKNVCTEHASTYHPIAIDNNIVRLPSSNANVKYMMFQNDTEHTVYVFVCDRKQVWELPQAYVQLYCVDRRLDLRCLSICRYLIIGNIDATIDRHGHSLSRLGVTVLKGAIVRTYVSGDVRVRTAVTQHARLSVCGSARSLKIYSLGVDCRLDLTCFEGRVAGSTEGVCLQSIHCRPNYPTNEETSREKQVREEITVPSLASPEIADDTDTLCQTCCTYKANAQFIPCTHVYMCLECTERMRTLEHSTFACPLCRKHIDSVEVACT